MDIKSVKFVKGIVGADDFLDDNIPQIAFIGRSNVRKSSVINAFTKQQNLAITSATPGRTQEINLFLINNNFYLIDLPGYGFVRHSMKARERLQKLIDWYLFESEYEQKAVVMVVDAVVGITDSDLDMLVELEGSEKNVIILANKIDKLKNSEYKKKLQEIQYKVGDHKVIPFSAKKKTGVGLLVNELFN